MKATVTVGLIGNPNRNVGEIVEGDEALQLVKAGYGEPIKDEPTTERADAPDRTEKSVRKTKTK